MQRPWTLLDPGLSDEKSTLLLWTVVKNDTVRGSSVSDVSFRSNLLLPCCVKLSKQHILLAQAGRYFHMICTSTAGCTVVM